jgi:CDGSH-type Zn-finger protein
MDKKNSSMNIKIKPDGPYLVTGGIPLSDQIFILDDDCLSTGYREGKKYPLQEEYELCRCGKSKDKPFCDGAHNDVEFDGGETASRKPFMEQAEPPTTGAVMDLYDVVPLCANARFCDRAGGAWDNTRASDDPEAKIIALQEVFDCPAGRLVLKDKAGNDIEPEFEPSIGLIIDPVVNVFGPIWVRGGIPIEGADGKLYEVRNRVTLCRCGKSDNRPYCDGKHVEGE